MKIELAKPEPGTFGPRGIGDNERFDRGERIILVDGARWGRTSVTTHGRHGMRYRFLQDGRSEVIEERANNSTYKVPATVWGDKVARRHAYGNNKPVAPVEERIIEKVREMIETGLLRDPVVVRGDIEEEARQYRAQRADARRAEEAAFHARACAALGVSINDHSEKVQAVIDAMRAELAR